MIDLSYGLNKLWSDPEQARIQRAVITEFAKDYRDIDPQILLDDKLFYVPNDNYMTLFWGEEIRDFKHGLYFSDNCAMYKRVVFPLYNFKDELIAFCGYANDGGKVVKYQYSPKRVFPKDRFIYIRKDEYIKAIKDGYIFVVDGLMDKKRYNSVGLNAAAQMGTTLTEYQKYYYEFIDHIIIAPDNDSAGERLYRLFKKAFPTKTISLYQNFGWDSDDFLKEEQNVIMLKNQFNKMQREGFITPKERLFKKITDDINNWGKDPIQISRSRSIAEVVQNKRIYSGYDKYWEKSKTNGWY